MIDSSFQTENKSRQPASFLVLSLLLMFGSSHGSVSPDAEVHVPFLHRH